MFDFLTTCRALADENRIRILMALRGRQLCVCQVTAFLDLAPSTTSKHLSILRQARLIESNKQGRWVYYRLADDSPRPNIREALAWMKDSLANDPPSSRMKPASRKSCAPKKPAASGTENPIASIP